MKLSTWQKPDSKSDWAYRRIDFFCFCKARHGLQNRASESGMIMIGDKKSLITGGRPNNPHLMVSDNEWDDFLKNAPEKTIPRVGEEQPQQEWIECIKNNTQPGSNFNYAADLTEMILIGVLSQRFKTKLEYDSANMRIINLPELNRYIKEPIRGGWAYGENF